MTAPRRVPSWASVDVSPGVAVSAMWAVVLCWTGAALAVILR